MELTETKPIEELTFEEASKELTNVILDIESIAPKLDVSTGLSRYLIGIPEDYQRKIQKLFVEGHAAADKEYLKELNARKNELFKHMNKIRSI